MFDRIAVSRYTKMAGDDFDEKLAEHFLCIRGHLHPNFPITKTIERQYQEYAEQAKIDLSQEISAQKTARTFDPKTCKIAFQSRGWDEMPDGVCAPPHYDLTLCKYEEIVAPCLEMI